MQQIGAEVIFDAKGADKKIDKLGQGFANVQSGADKTAAVSAKALAFGNFLGNMLTSGFDKLMGGISQAIPALGQTLGQAGQVIMNNLFKPLSDVLLPMLRQLMNWVRDNRAGFVQLGSVISGAFLFVVSVVKQVFGIISSIFGKFFTALTGGTKASFKSVADVMNMILLKLAFAIQFILVLIEPVIQTIADLFLWVVRSAIVPFFEGIFEGLSGIGDAFTSVFEAFSELGKIINDLLGETGGKTEWIATLFKGLGKIVGFVLKNFIQGVAMAITMFVKLVGYIIKAGAAIPGAFRAGIDWLKSAVSDVVDWFKSIPERIVAGFKSAFEKLGDMIKNSALGKFAMRVFGSDMNEPEGGGRPMTSAGGAAQAMTNNNRSTTANTTVHFNGPVANREEARAGVSQAQGASIQNLKAAQGY